MGCQTCKSLSEKLFEAGFFSAIGTTEEVGGKPRLVELGTPNRWDSNNGVTVVYDGDGRPWIIRGHVDNLSDLIPNIGWWLGQQNHGAYVPHSNDGGKFVRDVLPRIYPSAIKQ